MKMNKYIIRRFLILLVAIHLSGEVVSAEEKIVNNFPDKKKEWINDFANIIRPDDATVIESLCKQIYKEELATVVICTVESIPKVRKEYKSAVIYGTDLLNYWHVGRSGVGDGILILISLKDRKAAICTGYLAEHFLPDAEVGRILRAFMTPMFKKDEYGKGVIEGLKEAKKVMINNRKLMYPEKY